MNFGKAIGFLCISIIFYLAENSDGKSYEGYKIVNIKTSNKDCKTCNVFIDQLLKKISNNNDDDCLNDCELFKNIQVLNVRSGEDASLDLMISPEGFKPFEKLCEENGIEFKIMNQNVQKKIDKDRVFRQMRTGSSSPVGTFARHQDINKWIDTLVSQNPSLTKSYSAGKTFENRDIKVIAIGNQKTTKRKIWIDCGIHAREWISQATCVWMIEKFINEYKSNDAVTKSLLDYYEIHIVPVLNPDGYEYTHTVDRMWRKNRNKNSNSNCVGVDPNRNYRQRWLTGGSSTDPCDETYAGRSAGSEKEVQAVENSINKYLGQWDSFITIHAYGSYWFTPYGYAPSVPYDYSDLEKKAIIGSEALRKVNGKKYAIGSSAELLYVASGGAEDWTKDIAGIKYSYCLELTDFSRKGFLAPVNDIPKAGEETFQGLKAMFYSIRMSY